MSSREVEKPRPPRKKISGMVIVAVVVILVAAWFFGKVNTETTSASKFCGELIKQSGELGDQGTYAISFLDGRSSDAQDLANAMAALERVAPKEIEPDLETLRKTFETIKDDPSKTLEAGIGAIGPEDSVENWIDVHCGGRAN